MDKKIIMEFFKNNKNDKTIWVENGKMEFNLTFDKKKIYNLNVDYPYNMSKKEIEIFNKENPYWRKRFADRFK